MSYSNEIECRGENLDGNLENEDLFYCLHEFEYVDEDKGQAA